MHHSHCNDQVHLSGASKSVVQTCISFSLQADAQLAYLANTGKVSAIITEDSDLLAYGCPRVSVFFGSYSIIRVCGLFVEAGSQVSAIASATTFDLSRKKEAHASLLLELQVLFKVRQHDDHAEEIRVADLHKNPHPSFQGWSPDLFLTVSEIACES